MDVNVRAFRVVQAAISEKQDTNPREEAGRKGGLVGGPSRAQSISRERRVEIAKKASAARWGNRSGVKGR
jgi:general stress protein YciG